MQTRFPKTISLNAPRVFGDGSGDRQLMHEVLPLHVTPSFFSVVYGERRLTTKRRLFLEYPALCFAVSHGDPVITKKKQAYATVMYEDFSPEVSSIHAMLKVNGRVRRQRQRQRQR